MKAFISYSHRDEAMLERLHAHLAVLRKEGAVSAWYDRQILAGGSIDREVANELDGCEVFLALVSPDFLNSGYCYDKEMARAIERHEAGQIAIVPVILEPCDWQSSPLRQFKAIPKDGTPVSEWTNKNAAWLDVVTEIRRLTQNSRHGREESARTPTELRGHPVESSKPKYRVKQSFDQIDREEFRSQVFEKIRTFFESSCEEIDSIDGLRGRYESMGQSRFTCTVVNKRIKSERGGTSHITVRSGVGSFLGDLSWSFDPRAPDNTAHGSFGIESDDYHMFLRGMFLSDGSDKREWSAEEAAIYLWQEFIEKAGISI
jgi:hypothetical protein